jgi:hypothetical protein
MTAIANVALSNTFDYWRIRTNEAINFINTKRQILVGRLRILHFKAL